MVSAAIDTNVLVYAEAPYGARAGVRELLKACPRDRTFVPAQALGELYDVLVQKSRVERALAKSIVGGWTSVFNVVETSAAVLDAGLELASEHRLQIWDSTILAAAASAGCSLLLTEDMQDGFHWRGVTVVDPFAENRSPLLDKFLSQRRG